jgi:hypothetical protein
VVLKRKFMPKVNWQCGSCEDTMKAIIADYSGTLPTIVTYDAVVWEAMCNACRSYNYVGEVESESKSLKVETVPTKHPEMDALDKKKYELELELKRLEVEALNAELERRKAALAPKPVVVPVPEVVAPVKAAKFAKFAKAAEAPVPAPEPAHAVVSEGNKLRITGLKVTPLVERLTYTPPTGAPVGARRQRTSRCPVSTPCNNCARFVLACDAWAARNFEGPHGIVSNRYKPCTYKTPVPRVRPQPVTVVEDAQDPIEDIVHPTSEELAAIEQLLKAAQPLPKP